MGKKPVAQCGTKSGFNRHKRTLQDEPCKECRAAENAARRTSRKAPPKQRRYCDCKREIRTATDAKCSVCRKAGQSTPCLTCEKPAYNGNEYCRLCRDNAEAETDRNLPKGWMRDSRRGGILTGSMVPHNDPFNCTVHDWCSNQQREAA